MLEKLLVAYVGSALGALICALVFKGLGIAAPFGLSYSQYVLLVWLVYCGCWTLFTFSKGWE